MKNYILLQNIVWKKKFLQSHFIYSFLCVAGYLKRTSDTAKLIWIYISVKPIFSDSKYT